MEKETLKDVLINQMLFKASKIDVGSTKYCGVEAHTLHLSDKTFSFDPYNNYDSVLRFEAH